METTGVRGDVPNMLAGKEPDLLFFGLALRQDFLSLAQAIRHCRVWCGKGEPAHRIPQWLIDENLLNDNQKKQLSKDLHAQLGSTLLASTDDLSENWHQVEARQALERLAHDDDRIHQFLVEMGYRTQQETEDSTTSDSNNKGGWTSQISLRREYLLGEGAIGRVWLARDTTLNRYVAVKELRPTLRHSRAAQLRLIKEGQITGQLDHPGIVTVFMQGPTKEGTHPFYVMRPVDGMTLTQAIQMFHEETKVPKAQRVVRMRRLLQGFVRLCQALGYAHSRGVVHRDLKPSNVVWGRFGEVIVLDWGLAKVSTPSKEAHANSTHQPVEFNNLPPSASGELASSTMDPQADIATNIPSLATKEGYTATRTLPDAPVHLNPPTDQPTLQAPQGSENLSLDDAIEFASDDWQSLGTVRLSDNLQEFSTRHGQVLGTPAFMPPEQAAGLIDEVNAVSDVYGLGAILYSILTNRPPHRRQPDEGLSDLLIRIQQNDIGDLWEGFSGIPKGLKAVVEKAIAVKPAGRYQSALALGEDVERCLAGETPEAFDEPLSSRISRWFQQHRRLGRGLLMALIAFVVGCSCLALHAYRTTEQFLALQQNSMTNVARSVEGQLKGADEHGDHLLSLIADLSSTQKLLDDPDHALETEIQSGEADLLGVVKGLVHEYPAIKSLCIAIGTKDDKALILEARREIQDSKEVQIVQQTTGTNNAELRKAIELAYLCRRDTSAPRLWTLSKPKTDDGLGRVGSVRIAYPLFYKEDTKATGAIVMRLDANLMAQEALQYNPAMGDMVLVTDEHGWILAKESSNGTKLEIDPARTVPESIPEVVPLYNPDDATRETNTVYVYHLGMLLKGQRVDQKDNSNNTFFVIVMSPFSRFKSQEGWIWNSVLIGAVVVASCLLILIYYFSRMIESSDEILPVRVSNKD